MNTIQQAKDRAGLVSCQAVAPRIGSPDLNRSMATPATAYVQWATQVAPRVQPNSKANVADAPMQAMTAIPIRARKPIHIWQPPPLRAAPGRNQDNLEILLGQFQEERPLAFQGNRRIPIDNKQ